MVPGPHYGSLPVFRRRTVGIFRGLNVSSMLTISHSNLTNVNLVIFACPLLTGFREEYEALYTQAIGRACRFGQRKPVEIHHFLTLGTVDVNVVEGREAKRLILNEGRLHLSNSPKDSPRGLGSSFCQDTFQDLMSRG